MLCACAVQAADLPPPDENQLKLDGAIQGIKDEVLNFNRDALNVENDVLYPAYSRTSIYVGVKVSGLLLKTVSVAVDDKPAQTYSYSEHEAKALLTSKGLHRLMRVSLESGAHRISADYTAQFADAKPDEPPVTGHYEAIFDKYLRETELELLISRGSRLSKPQMTLRQHKVAAAGEAVLPAAPERKIRKRRTPSP